MSPQVWLHCKSAGDRYPLPHSVAQLCGIGVSKLSDPQVVEQLDSTSPALRSRDLANLHSEFGDPPVAQHLAVRWREAELMATVTLRSSTVGGGRRSRCMDIGRALPLVIDVDPVVRHVVRLLEPTDVLVGRSVRVEAGFDEQARGYA